MNKLHKMGELRAFALVYRGCAVLHKRDVHNMNQYPF